jgi:vancomycin resistance protein YoaR
MSFFRSRRISATLVALLLTLVFSATAAASFVYFTSSPSPAESADDLRATIVSRPHRFVAGQQTLVVRPAQLRQLVSVAGDRVVVDPVGLRALLEARFAGRPPKSAELRTSETDAWVVPAVTGVAVDARATAQAVAEAPRSTTHAVRFGTLTPAITTAQLERLRITEVVSEFATH